jgi:hypothetical protein
MFEKLFSYHEIGELEGYQRNASARQTDLDRRSQVPIAVIDDEPFRHETKLRNNGYNINFLGDIVKISDISDYNIILCDLRGVGIHLNEAQQGGYLIDEIKRNHPEKFVIAYTGGAKPEIIDLARESADVFLKKDAELGEWRDNLDRMIRFLTNPVSVWKRQRVALVDGDVPTLDILKLEDAYVRSVTQKTDSPYRNVVNNLPAKADMRGIAQSLIASGIFRLVIG